MLLAVNLAVRASPIPRSVVESRLLHRERKPHDKADTPARIGVVSDSEGAQLGRSHHDIPSESESSSCAASVGGPRQARSLRSATLKLPKFRHYEKSRIAPPPTTWCAWLKPTTPPVTCSQRVRACRPRRSTTLLRNRLAGLNELTEHDDAALVHARDALVARNQRQGRPRRPNGLSPTDKWRAA
jgi:hypothetical protein